MTDRALEPLSRLDFVTKLDFEGARGLSDDGLRLLARVPQLEELVLGGSNDRVTDEGLEVLRHLPALTRFAMGWAQRVTDAGVAHLASCDALERVNPRSRSPVKGSQFSLNWRTWDSWGCRAIAATTARFGRLGVCRASGCSWLRGP